MNHQPLTSFLDLLFPRSCAGCSSPMGEEHGHICMSCRADWRIIRHPFCSVCGNPVEGRIDHQYVCFACDDESPGFQRARCAARYEGSLQTLIQTFKYRHGLWLRRDLGDLLATCVAAHLMDSPPDLVMAVPLHPARERDRGYNQAEVLARDLAAWLELPFLRNGLERRQMTPTQTHLTARERAHNVRKAFAADRSIRVKDRRVLLVDDVMTTGATLSACARVLGEAGAVAVDAVALARGSL